MLQWGEFDVTMGNLMLQWGEFDVTMGSNDGAETCEIVGLFLLHSIGEKFNKDNIDLYRDGGLACFKNNNGKLGNS